MRLLKFNYGGGNRIVEPHCYGVTTSGIEGLRAYQVEGYSTSGTFGWKLFDLDNVNFLDLLQETYESPRSGYSKGDISMKRIYCEL